MKRTMIWPDGVEGGTAINGDITQSYLRFVDSRTKEEIIVMVTPETHVEFFTKLKRAIDTAIIPDGKTH